MVGDDNLVIRAFEEWNEGDHHKAFRNPFRQPREIIKSACQWCGDVGGGGQGFVKLKKNLINGEILAVKTIDCRMMLEDQWNKTIERGESIEDLRHPCLVQVKGRSINECKKRVTIFMEYVEGPSSKQEASGVGASVNLKSVLEHPPEWWTNASRAIVILGAARGIEYMHGEQILHRDLKPSNVLLDKRGWPKICDFDVARSDEIEDGAMTFQVGTLGYMAPEAFRGEYTMMSDWFSFSIILYEVFEGLRSRSGFSASDIQDEMNFTDKTPKRVQKLIESLLDPESDQIVDWSEACPIFDYLYDVVLNDMNLSEDEKKVVNEYVESIERGENDSDDGSDSETYEFLNEMTENPVALIHRRFQEVRNESALGRDGEQQEEERGE